MKKFLIIAGIVILFVIIVGAIYIYVNRENLANMAVEQGIKAIEQVTLDNLTPNYQREDIQKLIGDAKVKIKEKGINSPDLQSLMVSFQHAYDDKQLDSLEVKDIIDRFKAIAEE